MTILHGEEGAAWVVLFGPLLLGLFFLVTGFVINELLRLVLIAYWRFKGYR